MGTDTPARRSTLRSSLPAQMPIASGAPPDAGRLAIEPRPPAEQARLGERFSGVERGEGRGSVFRARLPRHAAAGSAAADLAFTAKEA